MVGSAFGYIALVTGCATALRLRKAQQCAGDDDCHSPLLHKCRRRLLPPVRQPYLHKVQEQQSNGTLAAPQLVGHDQLAPHEYELCLLALQACTWHHAIMARVSAGV